jgi:exosortase C (VPDSG-CTERM-specific)
MTRSSSRARASATDEPPAPTEAVRERHVGRFEGGDRGRLAGLAGYLAAVCGILWKSLGGLADLAIREDLHSHVLLIPAVSAYLLVTGWKSRAFAFRSDPVPGTLLFVAGLFALLASRPEGPFALGLNPTDAVAAETLAFLCFVVSGFCFILGRDWVSASAFPLAFLAFMTPMPDGMANAIERVSASLSAYAADPLFAVMGIPAARDGMLFHLPGITLEVASECSGIRSSWVLLITSVLAAHLLLRRTRWQVAFVLLSIPLGVFRNAFRIAVIGFLCVQHGPQMIDSALHRSGGPFFFVLSLVPLFGLLGILMAIERRHFQRSRSRREAPSPSNQ